jgi:putative Mg2+ transporter-C (MgtC) family protein
MLLFIRSTFASVGTNVEGWRQLGELGLALLLSAAVGFERELRQKSAGLRTHTLVGVGAGLFMLISKFGFTDVLHSSNAGLDPSRMAAQIVTGVGFLGAGIIFVRRDAVRGLTTAASIWLTAAIGSAAGAGLPILAAVTTAIYFIVAVLFPAITHRLPGLSSITSVVRIRYPDGKGILRRLLQVATEQGFAVEEVQTSRSPASTDPAEHGERFVEVTLHVHGKSPVDDLALALSAVPGVEAVVGEDINEIPD